MMIDKYIITRQKRRDELASVSDASLWIEFWATLDDDLKVEIRAYRDANGLSTLGAVYRRWPHLLDPLTNNPRPERIDL